MKKQVTVRQTSRQPEQFVLIIPSWRQEPELTLGPFGERVTREELGKFNMTQETASREIAKARTEFDNPNQTNLHPIEASYMPGEEPTKVSTRKPRLIVTTTKNGIPIEGVCSNCPDITFHLSFTSSTLEHLRALKAMFDRHLRRVHEDAGKIE